MGAHMTEICECILAWLFPPKLPGRLEDWEMLPDPNAEIADGIIRPKVYKNGIERYFEENPTK